ncbi:F-box domain protein [Purpureocillium lavendulum]|uniref:F-box domain protein n=1 Tax=Purpureocillium lavendulum TaxID=1247861 RepID=A0AB34FX11_9HYPO|nr:F-box domain protein [Purpureocillium lavendulum]
MDASGRGTGVDAGRPAETDAATTRYTAESHGDAVRALAVLSDGDVAGKLIDGLVSRLATASRPDPVPAPPTAETVAVGLAALDAFLQANVTGPVLPAHGVASLERRFTKAWESAPKDTTTATAPVTTLQRLQRACLAHLEVDGVAPYAHIPHLELFALARYAFVDVLASEAQKVVEATSPYAQKTERYSLDWIRMRVNVWHYKLLTQPSLGPGSNFAKSSQWSDVPMLASKILDSMDALLGQITGEEVWSTTEAWSREEKAQFLVEAANNYILLGRYEKAKETLRDAAHASGLMYALSGALGKRTKFQESSTSQLVVLARSRGEGEEATGDDAEEDVKPEALKLNNDTLLEEIHFTKDNNGHEATPKELPASLADLSPDEQPQLTPLDQIILLTEATLKDAFSPADTLTSEEILPFAVRVLADKSTNWQIYTQALLVRSRIEVHRSRTVERGVLQLQAVADQVLTDTSAPPKQPEEPASEDAEAAEVPAIQVTAPGQEQEVAPASSQQPTSFLPAPKAEESAPAHVRLRYIHALCTPPRWHLESELAYAWAGVGSLTSALEIFKRLRLWAEVALCLASAAAAEDEDGRGSGGEEKAKAIVRWRLFHKTGDDGSSSSEPDDEGVEDVTRLKISDYAGPERSPPPPNAPRLWCILGDLDEDPAHYERAWDISKHRYARAQKSLGEHYLRQKDWHKAHAAYKLATSVNRLSPDMWSRLGDINLRLGRFEEAAESYSRCIGSATDMSGGEDAKTWSNLGSSLWSLYCEVVAAGPQDSDEKGDSKPAGDEDDEEEEDERGSADPGASKPKTPSKLLAQALAAYKKGASIAHDNWRIWDNVLTLASRMRPPPIPDMVLAYKHILRIRKTEDAVDADMLAALLQDAVLARERDAPGARTVDDGVYEPPRGSPERLVARLVEEEVVPLVTHRADLWALAARLRAWRRDYAGAVEASERAWRAAVGSPGGGSSAGLLPGESGSGSATDWTSDEAAWTDVVKRTDELVSVLENYGPRATSVGSRWRGKARSAVRSVMGRGRENWEGSEGWRTLEGLMEGLKAGA